jgi:cyclic pyranopterin phosphate synthase
MRTKSTRALPIDVERRPAAPEVSAGKKLTHLDAAGRPKMVDIAGKPDSARAATAKGLVRMHPATYRLIQQGEIAKGDVLAVAQLAGIMAAKRTPDLIPLCHTILIDNVNIDYHLDDEQSTVEITATVNSTGKTGVEMEALTAAAVTALTIYDMCKAVDRAMKIENIRLVQKSGGKSGTIKLE